MSYNNVNLISHYIYIMLYDMIYGKNYQNIIVKAKTSLYILANSAHIKNKQNLGSMKCTLFSLSVVDLQKNA